MKSKWLVGTTMQGYGVTLTVGIGIPIPILNEEICRYTAVKDEDICLHCGLCAERCPTGAWDMQTYLYEEAKIY